MSLRGDLLACLWCALLVIGVVAVRQARSGDISGRSMLAVQHPYALVGVQSGKCVTAPAQASPGASLTIAACDGTDRQLFVLEPRTARTYRIRNLSNVMCVDVQGADIRVGAPVIQYPCNEGRNQRWGFMRVSPDVYELTVNHSDQQLDVKGAAIEDGTPLEQWITSHQNNQRFRLAR
jgi:hypothetical protein